MIDNCKHQNNPLVSAETIRHSSTYIILYVFHPLLVEIPAQVGSVFMIRC